MFTPQSLKSFFIENEIQLQSEVYMGEKIINDIFIKGLRIEYYFGCFLVMAVFNSNKDGFQTNFNDWDDLYEAYACFIVGAYGAKC